MKRLDALPALRPWVQDFDVLAEEALNPGRCDMKRPALPGFAAAGEDFDVLAEKR